MMKIKNVKYSLALLVTVLLAVSCIKEPLEGGSSELLPEGSVKIMLIGDDAHKQAYTTRTDPPNDGDATSENYVRKIQIFFYDNATQKLECVREYLKDGSNDEVTWDGATGALTAHRIPNVSEPKDIYVVTNWIEPLPVSITAGSDVSELKKQILEIKTPLPGPSHETPLLMSGSVTGHDFHVAGGSKQNTATVNIKRQATKIEVNMSIDTEFLNAMGADYIIEDQLVKISSYNLPSTSYITEQLPTPSLPPGSTMLKAENVHMQITGSTWSHKFYSYENPQMGSSEEDKHKATYFFINVPYTKKGEDKPHNNYYWISIDDVSSLDSPYKTLRNKHYTVTVTITGFGVESPVFDAIHAVTTVKDWASEDVAQEIVGKNMTINKTEVTLSGNTIDASIVVRGESELDAAALANPFSKVTYPTDMDLDMRGLVLGYQVGGDSKSITITIQNNATVPYPGTEAATFYIQYGLFKKKISVKYR